MKRNLLRFGLLSLLLVFACIAKAQDVTAIWDFQNNKPGGINAATNFEGKTGEVNSTMDGIIMRVDATTGKLTGRTSDAQFNAGTKLQIPVKSAKDVVTVTSYPNYHNYTVGGIAATTDVTEHKATSAEVTQGYVEVIATATSYLYQIKVVQASAIQEKALYSTDFTNWKEIDRSKVTDEVVNVKTLYSKEELSFTFNGVGVYPTGTNTKFPEVTGFMQTAKYTDEYKAAEPNVVTSALANITKITLHQAATGGKRGIKVSVKGDGDEDWVVIHNVSIAKASGEDLTLDVNRTNCQIKFENFALGQNAYVTDLTIYGNVDMSKTPMLGSFSLNGEKYQAVDIFNEDATGKQLATILVSKKANLISETNPLTEITADNGTIKSTTYTTTGEGNNQKTVISIVVEANGDEAIYELTVGFKPDFTLTYYDIDETTAIGTQKVEQDATIASFDKEAEGKVTVTDGKKFRGWATSVKQDEKKYTTSSVITSDTKLYAVVTDIETANTTARYDFNLQKEGFCADDHEAFCVEGNGKWHDKTHGWTFAAGDKIKILMGGKGYLKLDLCQYSTTGEITLTDPKGNKIASVEAKANKDGISTILQNSSTESGEYTLTFAVNAYLHSLSIVNMTEPAYAQDGNWYTVKAGDAKSFSTTLEIVNAANAATDAPRSYIFLPDGTYDLGDKCLTQISGNNISIIGESMDKTIIVNKPAIENEGIGTTATLLNTSNNLYMQDVTLQNALEYYKSGSAGRAVCLQDRGTQTICKNVKMLSYQDTYYSNEPNGKGQFYFEDSEIHGTVDYVCGGGDVYFNRVLFVNESRKEGEKYGEDVIAAPNSKSEWGYIFKDCTIENKAANFSLGRSWNNITRLTWLNTTVNQKDEILNDDKKYAYFTINAMGDAMADKFRLDVLKDAEGNVFSPAEKKVIFKNSGATQQKAEENIILTAEEAATYTLDAVFGDWKPEAKAAQATATATTLKDGKLSWTGDAKMYLVAKDGKFYTLTTENSLIVNDDKASFTVRAANGMGGFGTANGTVSTGINSTMTTATTVIKTAIFAADGTQLSNLQKGINIIVKTFKDGSKKTSKVIVK
ncbi:pectin esterase [Prevotella sp. AM42-24]|uniref:pectinesterase family protein n=1 Tax=Prevotella sp. AM42-24 TaxID=2293125 RepID=UPI000E4EA575|nr:pectinesterase family protein [Prevotella sp. AM42-24]RGH39587.1 pectin esterase [Prevotella sp. AM42-24]